MAEFLLRGWNVALPEIDIGEDLFVIEDETGLLTRIQVKTATARTQRDGYSAQFSVALRQLSKPRAPDLIYIFAFRSEDRWEPFVIIERSALREEQALHRVGSVSGDNVVFRFVSSGAFLTCSGRDFRSYRGDWSRWPVLPIALRNSS
ncbi:MAG: hypothetical protein ACJ76J_02005 [Thermoanaerobaculia bacterium]